MNVIEDVQKILTFPTHLESTSIVVTVGKDWYCVPVYVGNAPYDVLSPFFNYWLLYVSVSFVLMAVAVTSVMARKKALFNTWK